MPISPLWLGSFCALWLLMIAVAWGLVLLTRYALRLERELLDTTDGPEVGATVPKVSLVDLSGRSRPLLPAGASKAAVVFLSPSCPACRQVSRSLSALPDDLNTEVLVVCQASPEAARRYLQQSNLHGIAFADPEGDAMRAFEVTGIPFIVVIDAGGRVLSRGVAADYRELLQILGEKDDATQLDAPLLRPAPAGGPA